MSKWNPRSHITDLIIQGLERGVGPWVRPWRTKGTLGISPFNPCTAGGRAYNGMNTWTLAIKSHAEGWYDPRFCTFKQLEAKGWQIRKGQGKKDGGPGPADVFFWLIRDYQTTDEDTGETVTRKSFQIKVYKVWNLSQLDGPEAWETDEDDDTDTDEGPTRTQELAWGVTEAWDGEVAVNDGGNRACYSPALDVIRMPELADFKSEGDYLATRFHEQVHSTGHESREGRDFSGRFGNEAYAMEELVAEIGAANLMAATGVSATGEVRDDHVAYIASWIKVLKGDNKAIFTADSQAKKAVSRILEHAEEAGVLPKPSDNAKPKSKGKKKTRKSAQ